MSISNWNNGKCPHGWPVVTVELEDRWQRDFSSPDCTLCRPNTILSTYKEPLLTPFICVLSGGQDSTTSLAWALKEFGHHSQTAGIFFDYGQRHLAAEQEAARRVAEYFNIPLKTLTVSSLKELGDSALTDHSKPITHSEERDGLPSTFTPGRNMIFFTLAVAFGYKLGHEDIKLVSGVCQTDYSGYPDCRRNFVDDFESAAYEATDKSVRVYTPLMELTKKETVELMAELGHLDAYALSHTCYNGDRPPCGTCPACILRAKGFAEAGVPDPVMGI